MAVVGRYRRLKRARERGQKKGQTASDVVMPMDVCAEPASDKGDLSDLEFVRLSAELWSVLKHLSLFLHKDPVLFCKICRVYRELLAAKDRCDAAVSVVTYDPPLMTHLVCCCRRLKAQAVMQPRDELRGPPRTALSISEELERILCECLLPSLSMMTANCQLCVELWDVISLLPYTIR